MRTWWLVLLLAGLLSAQEDGPAKKKRAPTAFDTPPPGTWGGPGVRARYAESLARAKQALTRNLGDADALERTFELCQQLGRTSLVTELARKAVKAEGIDGAARLRNRGILGVCLVNKANSMGSRGIVWRFGANGAVLESGRTVSDEQKKIFNEAIEHLRAAAKRDQSRPALRYALAEALEALEEKGKSNEADRLREQADVLAARTGASSVAIGPYAEQAETLIEQAMEAEQKKQPPDHVRALELRKQALVLSFCRDTIPFDYTVSLYGPVSLLADRTLVVDFLTRTFTNSMGETGVVAPKYHGAGYKRHFALVEALGKEQTSGADAVLLALVRGTKIEGLPIPQKAQATLAADGHKSAHAGLPLLLAKALYAQETDRFPPPGQRMLIDLAVRRQVKQAAPVLAAALPRDVDLRWPRGIALAIGRLGTAEDADALLKIANDSRRDICFRRAAARGAVLLAPERATELKDTADLAIAIAAARFELTPDDDSRGRILNGLEEDLEIDEAARYCAELGIVEARPALEEFLRTYGTKRDHAARLVVEHALQKLRSLSE